jgi:transcriptional regulator with XRE-family HTH domain
MNLDDIGKFLTELRKEQGLTQEQLGEKIGVTNKTISRWETGVYLPPADALLALSKVYSVSINEILAGKRLTASEYKSAAEENLQQAIEASSFTLKERIAYYKKKWFKEHIAFILVLGLIEIAVIITGVVLRNGLILCLSIILLLVFHCVRNNRMMSYVERNAYDGKS